MVKQSVTLASRSGSVHYVETLLAGDLQSLQPDFPITLEYIQSHVSIMRVKRLWRCSLQEGRRESGICRKCSDPSASHYEFCRSNTCLIPAHNGEELICKPLSCINMTERKYDTGTIDTIGHIITKLQVLFVYYCV